MTREQFIKVLNKKEYEWKEEEGEWIVVEETGDVYLESLKSIPNNVQFSNSGHVNLHSLESIGDNVQFRNGGSVNLSSLKSIPINLDSDEMFPKCYDIKINWEWLDLEKNITFPDSRWKSVDNKVQMYESWVKNNY